MNTDAITATPTPYSPDVETLADDEGEVIQELNETLLKMSKVMLEHTGHGMRSVHAKSYGLLRGTLEVLPGLPPRWRRASLRPRSATT